MIVCSCRGITSRDIHAAIDWMRASDPQTVITPGKVYRALGTSPGCGGCIRLFIATMRGNAQFQVPKDDAADLPAELRHLRVSAEV